MLSAGAWAFLFSVAHSASLTRVSDLISTSRPTVGANHTLTFVTTTAIPVSGTITIAPEAGAFTLPASFSYTDVDFATAPALSGPFTERSLTALANVATDGVTINSGTSGSVTITLNSSAGIGAGQAVRLKLGTHATFDGAGIWQLSNPSTERSYRITLRTFTAFGAPLDEGTAMVAVVSQISVGPVDTTDTTPPMLSNGLPAGALPGGTQFVELSLNSNEWARCRFGTTENISYADITTNFTNTLSTFHTTTVGPLAGGQTHTYYVRCQDYAGNATLSDFPITFSIAAALPPPPPPAPPPSPPGTGVPSSVTANPPQPTTSTVTLDGTAYPLATVTFLRDGKIERAITSGANGRFSTSIGGLERGVYTFGIFAKDTEGRKSVTFPSTFSIGAGTNTVVGNILLPPTMVALKTTVASGESVSVSGQAAPEATIELIGVRQDKNAASDTPMKAETVADAAGKWSILLETIGFPVDTYELKARLRSSTLGVSEFSYGLFVGVGKAPTLDFAKRSDMNKDNRVNIVDFSILLFHWGKDSAIADINASSKVDLTDFSILIFNWTG